MTFNLFFYVLLTKNGSFFLFPFIHYLIRCVKGNKLLLFLCIAFSRIKITLSLSPADWMFSSRLVGKILVYMHENLMKNPNLNIFLTKKEVSVEMSSLTYIFRCITIFFHDFHHLHANFSFSPFFIHSHKTMTTNDVSRNQGLSTQQFSTL